MVIRLAAEKLPVIDMHAHLRNEVLRHTAIAEKSGIDFVVAMPNTEPCLDTLESIREYAGQKSHIPFAPMSAITAGRKGKQLVDVESIAPYAVGFTDDGNCLKDLEILRDILDMPVWVMLHAGEESPAEHWPRRTTESTWVEKYLYLKSVAKTKGMLYIQHVSRKESVDLIREAKKDGIPVVAETCPHYFKWTRDTMRVPVNPPIGDKHNRDAIREGLHDGTISIIASDYAPEPRPKKTGIADWENHVHSCRELVWDGVLNENRLFYAISRKPLEVIRSSSGYKAGNIKLPNWI